MLSSMNPSSATLKVFPGLVSQVLEGFGVPGVCLCWKCADQGRAVAKPVPELAAPWLPSEEVAPLAKVHSSTNAYNIWHWLSP